MAKAVANQKTKAGKPRKRPARKDEGRPSLYDPKYCSMLVAFMKRGGAKVYRPMSLSHGLQAGSEIVDHPIGKLPALLEDFATKIGVTMETLFEWGRKHPEFSESYDEARHIQKAQMLRGGLSGAYNSPILNLAMKNMHGWKDKAEFEHSGEVRTGPGILLPPGREPENGKANGHRDRSAPSRA
jgi:hypothetical protein